MSAPYPDPMGLPLKIGILSISSKERPDPELYMIKRAAVGFGHKSRIFQSYRFSVAFDAARTALLYKGKPFKAPDVMIIRPYVLQDVDHNLATVKQLQLMDVPVVNRYLPIVRAKNKVRTLQILKHEGIPIPRTMVVQHGDAIEAALEQFSTLPVIIKTVNGSLGLGVSIVESLRSLRSTLDLIVSSTKSTVIIIQEYVKEAKGKDIRVFVVGGKIVAAMARKAKRGEFRANFNRGGSVEVIELSEEEKKIALESARVIGLDVAGVDIIRTAEGPKILEVNSNPGLEGITMATNVNVAGEIVFFSERLVKQRELRHRQRADVLTVA